MQNRLALFKQYNELTERLHKAEAYMDNPANPMNEREKWVPEFIKIYKEADAVLKQIEATGREVTEREILEGFDETTEML